MCHSSCIEFGKTFIRKEDVRGKSIIEVGSYDINGSLRGVVEALQPSSYIGVDIEAGPGVDQICAAEDLIKKFGYDRFDMVLCTELLEHVKDWQTVIHNLKDITKPGGVLFITTRSKGFGYHGFPVDFWRYEKSDMKAIFSDFDIEALELDSILPGVLLKARKPLKFAENKLEGYKLYSIVQGKRSLTTTPSLYWRVIGFPIWNKFCHRKYLSEIVHFISNPAEIPFLIKWDLKKLFEKLAK